MIVARAQRTASFVAVGLLLIAPSGADASRRRVSVLVANDAPQSWEDAIAAAVSLSQAFSVRRALAPVRTSDGVRARQDVRDATVEIELSFRMAAFDECLGRARSAEEHLAAALVEADLMGELAPLLLLTSACEAKRGAPEAALERLRLALAIDPGLSLDPDRYPPEVTQLFEAARRADAEAPRFIVHPVVIPSNARVELDGRPWPADGVVRAGPHFVVARALGATTLVRTVRLVEGANISLQLEPAPPDVARAHLGSGPSGAQLDASWARAAGRAAGANYVLSATRQAGRTDVVLWRLVGVEARRLGHASAPAPRSREAWSRLLSGLHEGLAPVTPRSVTRSGGPPAWVWVALGGAVLSAGAVAGFFLLSGEEYRLIPGGVCFGDTDVCQRWGG